MPNPLFRETRRRILRGVWRADSLFSALSGSTCDPSFTVVDRVMPTYLPTAGLASPLFDFAPRQVSRISLATLVRYGDVAQIAEHDSLFR